MVNVFFATNRDMRGSKDAPGFGSGFSKKGPSDVRFGWAEVTGPNLDQMEITVASERLGGRGSKLGSKETFAAVKHKMEKHSRDTVVFLHGYANSFRSALSHAALLKQTYDAIPFNMVLFSWPSDGQMIPYASYYSDRDDARASEAAIARTFLKLNEFLTGVSAEEECGQRLHLMAHSMGNYALRNGLQGIRAILGDDLPRVFDNIFLFAADEDDNAFEHDHKLRLLPRIGRLVNVYHRRDDRALLVSDITKANPDRLGSDGPRLIDNLPRKVIVLNCRGVSSDGKDRNRHDGHRYSPEVIADINDVLRGIPPEDIAGREFSAGSRAYRIVGADHI